MTQEIQITKNEIKQNYLQVPLKKINISNWNNIQFQTNNELKEIKIDEWQNLINQMIRTKPIQIHSRETCFKPIEIIPTHKCKTFVELMNEINEENMKIKEDENQVEEDNEETEELKEVETEENDYNDNNEIETEEETDNNEIETEEENQTEEDVEVEEIEIQENEQKKEENNQNKSIETNKKEIKEEKKEEQTQTNFNTTNFGNFTFTKSIFTNDSNQFNQNKTENNFEQQKETNDTEDEEDDILEEIQREDPNLTFDPVVKLEIQEQQKIEEEIILSKRGKCAKYDKETNSFKERGQGDIQILKNPKTGYYQVVLVRDQIFKLGCNHFIHPTIVLNKKPNNERLLQYSVMRDYAMEDETEPMTFVFQFNSKEHREEFCDMFVKLQKEIEELINKQKNDEKEIKPKEEKIEIKVDEVKEEKTTPQTSMKKSIEKKEENINVSSSFFKNSIVNNNDNPQEIKNEEKIETKHLTRRQSKQKIQEVEPVEEEKKEENNKSNKFMLTPRKRSLNRSKKRTTRRTISVEDSEEEKQQTNQQPQQQNSNNDEIFKLKTDRNNYITSDTDKNDYISVYINAFTYIHNLSSTPLPENVIERIRDIWMEIPNTYNGTDLSMVYEKMAQIKEIMNQYPQQMTQIFSEMIEDIVSHTFLYQQTPEKLNDTVQILITINQSTNNSLNDFLIMKMRSLSPFCCGIIAKDNDMYKVLMNYRQNEDDQLYEERISVLCKILIEYLLSSQDDYLRAIDFVLNGGFTHYDHHEVKFGKTKEMIIEMMITLIDRLQQTHPTSDKFENFCECIRDYCPLVAETWKENKKVLMRIRKLENVVKKLSK